MDADALVVGAGAAGLAAARDLSCAGVRVIVLEAQPRIGGRVYTEVIPGWDLPVELGAEFVHGEPESTLSLAREARVELVELKDGHALRTPEGLTDRGDVWERLAKTFRKHGREHDTRLSEYLDEAGLAPSERSLAEWMVEGFEAAPVSDISVMSLREEFASGSPRQFRPAQGYGPLLECLRHAMGSSGQVHLNTPVTAVQWSEKSGVRITTRDGRAFAAPRAVVTVPLPVLRPEDGTRTSLQFDPPLTERQHALAQLGMGQAVRVVLRFNARVWPEDLPFDFIHTPGAALPTCWLRSTGQAHQVTAWAGGPSATALASHDGARLREVALACAATAIDVPLIRARASLVDSHTHDFQHDPFCGGAYSYVRPGGLDAAQTLQEPLGGVLVLGGEATDTEHAGTVAGALASGSRAARQVLARL